MQSYDINCTPYRLFMKLFLRYKPEPVAFETFPETGHSFKFFLLESDQTGKRMSEGHIAYRTDSGYGKKGRGEEREKLCGI